MSNDWMDELERLENVDSNRAAYLVDLDEHGDEMELRLHPDGRWSDYLNIDD